MPHCIRPREGGLGRAGGGMRRYMPLSYLGKSREIIKKKNPMHSKTNEPVSAILRKKLRHNWQNLRQNGYLPNSWKR